MAEPKAEPTTEELTDAWFEAIAWTDLESAVTRAGQEQKPLHAVLLFGVLDDESC